MGFIKLAKTEYGYLKVTPIAGLRNFNNKDLCLTINKLLLKFSTFEKTYDKTKCTGININKSRNISYILDISKKGTSFIFKVPVTIITEFKTKLQETYKNTLVTEIEYTEKMLDFNKYLCYQNYDFLSLHTDSRQQELINNILENIENFEDDDNVSIKINFNCLNKLRKLQFKDAIKDTEKRIKEGLSLKRSVGIAEGLGLALINTGKGIVDGILSSSLSSDSKDKNDLSNIMYLLTNKEEFKLSKSTINKKRAQWLNVSIQVTSTNRQVLESVLNSFNILEEDNMLVASKYHEINTMSVQEAGQLLQICGNAEIMDKYNIEYLKHKQCKAPSEILKGVFKIGSNSYRNSNQDIYLSDVGSNKFLATLICGPSRAGKTTLFQNLINNALDTGSAAFFLDFVETCRASNQILEKIPKDKVVIINLAEKVEGLDFNEIDLGKLKTADDKYRLLKLKANGILALIDSCNLTSDEELRSQMKKILMSSILVASSQGRPFKDAIRVLQDHEFREEVIDNIPSDLTTYLADSILNLSILDEKDKKGKVIGTKTSKTNSILNRLYALQINIALESMLKTDSKNNVNILNEIQKGKFIVVQIPDKVAPTNVEKDIICAYYFNKFWFALQQRAEYIADKDKIRVLFLIDEIYQIKNTELLLKSRINQVAKYHVKFVVSAHSVEQIRNLKGELKSSNASYVLLSGADETCLKDLKQRYPNYTVDDLNNLKQYHALCSLKTDSSGYVNCIVKLPPPIQ